MLTLPTMDTRRRNVAALISSERKSELGQFMTPSGIAAFMASLFGNLGGRDIRLLDAGAGIGSLTAAFVERAAESRPHSVSLAAWEIDSAMREHLEITLDGCQRMLAKTGIRTAEEINSEDFILAASRHVGHMQPPRFTHTVLNPL